MHLMIDIETLATTPDAVVLEIGALLFDPSGERAELPDVATHGKTHLAIAIDPTDQIIAGRRIDPQTLAWWRKQPILPGKDAHDWEHDIEPIASALQELCASQTIEAVWANSPSFDLVILRNLIGQFNYGLLPWRHWEERDVRTIKALATATGWEPPAYLHGDLTAHSALDDCVAQARIVQSCLRHLGRGTLPERARRTLEANARAFEGIAARLPAGDDGFDLRALALAQHQRICGDLHSLDGEQTVSTWGAIDLPGGGAHTAETIREAKS